MKLELGATSACTADTWSATDASAQEGMVDALASMAAITRLSVREDLRARGRADKEMSGATPG